MKTPIRRKHQAVKAIALLLSFILFVLPYLLPSAAAEITAEALAQESTNRNGRFVTIDGVQTYLVEHGPADGTPLLFIHGVFASTYTARHQFEPLAAAGYRVLAYDQPGTGLSDKPRHYDYSLAHQADFAAHLLDQLAIERAVIWAHSGGGPILTHFALKHSGRVDRLIIVDGAILGADPWQAAYTWLLSPPPFYRWAQIGVRSYFSQAVLADKLRDFYGEPASLTAETISAYWQPYRTAQWENGLLGQLRDGDDDTFSDAQLQQLQATTLIVWGGADDFTPLAQGERLAELLANSRLRVIEGAGHMPMEEAPAQFNQIILQFLKETT